MRIALSSKQQENRLLVVDELPFPQPKAKAFAHVFSTLNVPNALIIDTQENLDVLRRAGGNFINYHVLPIEGANVYDIMSYEYLVVTKAAAKALEEKLHVDAA